MNKYASNSMLTLVAVAALLAAGSASAQAVVTPASSTWHLNGNLALHQSQNLTCTADFDLSVNSDGATGTVTAGGFSGGFGCGFPLVYPRNFSWPVNFTWVDADTATFELDLDVQALFNVCVGTLTGTFDESTQTVDFSVATVAGSSPVCSVDGVLDVTPVSHAPNPLQVRNTYP